MIKSVLGRPKARGGAIVTPLLMEDVLNKLSSSGSSVCVSELERASLELACVLKGRTKL